MKKLFLAVFVIVLISSLLIGCSPTTSTTTSSPTAAKPQTQAPATTASTSAAPATAAPTSAAAQSAFKWPSSVTITTPATGGAPNVATLTWAPMLEQSTGSKVRVLAEGTAALTRQWLKDGKYNFFIESQASNGGTWFAAKYADATREGGPYPLRVVWMATLQDMGIMAQGTSSIKTIYDLKPGSRFAQFTGAKSTNDAVLGLMAWLNYTSKDVTVVPYGSWTANMKAISDGSADVAFGHPANAAAVEVEASPKGLRWLDVPGAKDPEGWKRFLKVVNLWPYGPITTGMKSAQGVTGLVSPFYIYAREDTDPELVYNLVKWLDTNFDKYKVNNVNCESMGIKTFRSMLDFIYLPVHPGTIKYLKDTGVWKSTDEAKQTENVALLVKWQETYKAAIAEADKQKIEIDPKNAKWTDLLASYIKDLPSIGVKIQ